MSDNTIIETLSDNPEFIPATSTNEIYVDTDMTVCLTDVLYEKADIDHTHDEYASQDDLNTLEGAVAAKANAIHTHTEYASATHSHSGYALKTELDTLALGVDAKADTNHSHSEYALQSDLTTLQDGVNSKADVNHTHSDYALISHSHDNYADSSHTHNDYSVVGHDHDEDYSAIDHSHNNYATTTALDEVAETVSGKADSSHTHTGVYDVSGAAANALTSANAYTDSKIDALVGDGAAETLDTIGEISAAIEDNQDALDLLNSAIGNKANVVDLNTHTNDTEIHITNTERNAWNAKSNFSGNYNDLTNKPNIPSVDGLATETYVNTQIGAIDIPNALSDLTTDSTHRVVTDTEKAVWNAKSDFSGSYNDLSDKPSIPSISGLATETYVDEAIDTKADIAHNHAISEITNLQSTLNSKATSDHNHNGVYYTETEINTLLANKSDTTHNHNSVYDALGTAEAKASEALNSAEEYADEVVANEVTARDSAIATAKSSAISTASSDATTKVNNHNVSTSAHNDIRTLIADLTTKLNNFLDVDDTTTDELSEVIALINNNKGTLESLTTSKVNVSDIVDNLTTSSASKVLSAKQGVAIKTLIDALQAELDGHIHAIADVSGLQSALNGKASTSHGTHVSYSSTAPVMDGVASVGSASTVARSDHKHPTDTSRASQTDLDALETVVSGKANSTHSHTISDVANLQTTLDTKTNQNAFSNVKVGSTTIAADTTTDTLTLVAGTNVILTPDATNDKITISSTDTNTTYSAGTGISLSGTTFSNSGVRSVSTGSSNGTISVNTNGTSANVAVKGLGSAAYTASTAYDAAGTAQTKANEALASAKVYADGIKNDLLNGAGTAYDTLKELGDLIDDNVDAIDALETVAASKASTSDLTSHTSNKSNPHGVTLAQLGVTATASELNKMDGITATTAELNIMDGVTATTAEINYLDGVTSSIQTQLNGKAASSHGTHVTYSTTAPKANGTAAVGTATTVSRSDHVHPLQSTVSGNAGTATKLATARTISLTGDVTGSTSFDGSGNVSITATVADDSHNHTIANIDNLQTTLNGKASSSHNHNSAYISKDLQMTADNGDISISWSGKDVVAQFKALASGMYTAYSPIGNTNNPNSGEAFRFMCHKTGSVNYGWIMAYGGKGSVYTGYIDNGNWQGWKALWEYAPQPLWSGGANGGYYMTATHTITPTKKLSECRNGWALLWSDYDVGGQANNTDFYVSYIYKRAYTGQVWGGGEWYCDIPSYSAGTATDSEQRVIKLLQIYDAKIVGTANNAAAPRNDVVLRAVYEF